MAALALTCWLAAGTAHADRGGNSPVTVIPAGNQGTPVQLRAQTVDVTLAEDKEGVWADTRVWLQLSNPLTRPVSLTLSLPGPQLNGGELPANLQLKLGDNTLSPQAAQAPAAGLVTQIAMAAREEVGLQLTYRQALPEAAGVVSFAYPLAAASKWRGTPESLKMTLSFATPPAGEQVLAVSPEPGHSSSQTMVWSWDAKAAPDIWLAFLAPSWWSRFAAARSAASAPGAGAGQHLALSQIYQELAALPQIPFAPELDFYARYYPAAIAELQAATAPGGSSGTPSAEEIKAHGVLARVYRAQAGRMGAGGGGGNTYLELAAAEAQAALSLGANDAELRAMATDAYLQLAAEARSQGNVAAADAYLAHLAALEPASRNSSAAEEQKSARLALAAAQLARGDLAGARQIVAESFGEEAVNIPALRAPLVGQVLVSVDTTVTEPIEPDSGASLLGGRRRLQLTLADSPDQAAVTSMIQQVSEAWRPVDQGLLTAGSDWLAIEIAYADDHSLIEIQNRLAKLLPNYPELALLAATLVPDGLSLRAGQDEFRQQWRYSELADLASATDAWRRRGQEIREAGERLAAQPAADPTPAAAPATPAAASTPPAATPGPELGQIQRALWAANAQSWENLVTHSYAQYSVRLGEPGTARQWQVQAGTRRTLEAEKLDWRTERLALVAAGGALGLLVVAYILWRLL